MRLKFNTKVYPRTYSSDHPMTKGKGSLAVHRAVAYDVLGVNMDGMHVHHKDDNPLNNSPDNLEVVTPMDHTRIHRGWKRIDGQWWKTCRPCGRFLKVDDTNFYRRPKGYPGEFESKCKECIKRKNRKEAK